MIVIEQPPFDNCSTIPNWIFFLAYSLLIMLFCKTSILFLEFNSLILVEGA